MDLDDARREHARLFTGIVDRIVQKLGESRLRELTTEFAFEKAAALSQIPDELNQRRLFFSWLLFEAKKDGKPVVDWYCTYYKEQLSPKEQEVLSASRQYKDDLFKVVESAGDTFVLEGVENPGPFTVEVVDMPSIEKDAVIMARIVCKPNGKYFFYGPVATMVYGLRAFEHAKKRKAFVESFDSTLTEFEKYLSLQGLSRKTVRKHVNKIDSFFSFLENETVITNFDELTKGMVKSRLSQWTRMTHEDVDEVRSSVKKFLRFLSEEKGVQNVEAVKYL